MPTKTDNGIKSVPPTVSNPDTLPSSVEASPSSALRGTAEAQDGNAVATEVRWQVPKTARSAHAFPANDSQSLCGGWIFMGERKPLPGQRRCAVCAEEASK